MKKIWFVYFFLTLSITASAQLELKVNPLGLFFGDYSVSAEFGLAEDIGLEPFAGLFTASNDLGSSDYKLTAGRFGAMGKYYFSPKDGIDGFHAGLYTRFATGTWKLEEDGSNLTDETDYTRFSLGILIGQKWVSKSGLIIELNFGAGRAFVNEIDGEDLTDLALLDLDLLLRLMVGYRF
jgi:hypothetical protein